MQESGRFILSDVDFFALFAMAALHQEFNCMVSFVIVLLITCNACGTFGGDLQINSQFKYKFYQT